MSGYYIFKPSAYAQSQVRQKPQRQPAAIQPADGFAQQAQKTSTQLDDQIASFFSFNQEKKSVPFETSLKMYCDVFFADQLSVPSKVQSGHVILKLSQCKDFVGPVKSISLVNQTNGYNAQLFKVGKSELNSDFIQLDPGDNELKFEFSLNDGQKKSHVVKILRLQ